MEPIQVYRMDGSDKFNTDCLQCFDGLVNGVTLTAAINAAVTHNESKHESDTEVIVCGCAECVRAITRAFLNE